MWLYSTEPKAFKAEVMGWDGKGTEDEDEEKLGTCHHLAWGRVVGTQNCSSCDRRYLTHRGQG